MKKSTSNIAKANTVRKTTKRAANQNDQPIQADAETLVALSRGILSKRRALAVIQIAARECTSVQEAEDLGFVAGSGRVSAPNPFKADAEHAYHCAYNRGRISQLQLTTSGFSAFQYHLPPAKPARLTKRIADHLCKVFDRWHAIRGQAALVGMYLLIVGAVVFSNGATADEQQRAASYSKPQRITLTELVAQTNEWDRQCSVVIPCSDGGPTLSPIDGDIEGSEGEQLPLPFPAPKTPVLTLVSE